MSTEYFDEHSHIDVHHGRMALKRLIIPMIEQFGDKIIPDLIRGFEEFKLLQDIADEELYAHINLERNPCQRYVCVTSSAPWSAKTTGAYLCSNFLATLS